MSVAPGARRRRWGIVLAVVAAVLLAAGLARLAGTGSTAAGGSVAPPPTAGTDTAGTAPPPPPSLVVEIAAGRRTLQRVDASRALRPGAGVSAARLRRVLAPALARTWTVAAGRARVVYGLDAAPAIRQIVAAGGPVARVQATARSSSIKAPVVAQTLHNDCEAAALEVLLATVGRRRAQLELQAALPRSGPLDPVDGPNGQVWGDPELGYVGRPDGGGPAGGFGVYQRPVRKLAARLRVPLEDLTGHKLSDLVAAVRQGRAVMTWVGLGDGPFATWRSPAGRTVRVNFNEHAVVLTGVTPDGRVRVVNVLGGTLETWTQSQLLTMWQRIGRRALAAPPLA